MRRGFIEEEDTPPTSSAPAIRRFRLQGGAHVYLPSPMAAWLLENHRSSEELFFLERGFLNKVEWAGNEYALQHALAVGQLTQRDLHGMRIEPLQALDGWYPVPARYFHAKNGLGNLSKYLRDEGKPELAAALTTERWLEETRQHQRCLAERVDEKHGPVWCELPTQHQGGHIPVCPDCFMAFDVIYLRAHTISKWVTG